MIRVCIAGITGWVGVPLAKAIRAMRPGALLVSMLHYPTRPKRTAMIAGRGLRAVSLDSIVDDLGRRLIENLESVGWNGVRAAFEQLEQMHDRFADPGRAPLRVTVLGSGHVASHAIRAATRYGNAGVRDRLFRLIHPEDAARRGKILRGLPRLVRRRIPRRVLSDWRVRATVGILLCHPRSALRLPACFVLERFEE